jgi:dolichyl-phosphate beta-glucosyltransferase
MPSFAIIIPCYNEEKRLQVSEFTQFIKLHKDITILFVNDGSSDNTINLLKSISSINENIGFIDFPDNKGKGEAVRQGIIHALKKQPFDYVGYLDADLSTSLKEYYDLCIHCFEKNADFAFGSRIKKLGSDIKRSYLRHISARMLVTIIDKKFALGYYDTQCGTKVFKSSILQAILNKPFMTKWFFDIEIFLRLRKENENYIGIEYPLKKWHNVKGSKINILSLPLVCKEVFALFSKYK